MTPLTTSVNPYGKIDADAQARLEAKRKERRRLCIIICCSVFLTIAVVSLAIGLVVGRKESNNNTSSSSSNQDDQYSTGALAIQAACNTAPFVDTCVQTLISYNGSLSASPLRLVSIAVQIALNYTQSAAQYAINTSSELSSSRIETAALQDCYELLSLSSDQLVDAIAALSSLSLNSNLQIAFQRIEIILSTASAEQAACSDNMEFITGAGVSAMLATQEKVNEVILNSLALVESLSNLGSDFRSWKNAVRSIPSLFNFRRRLLQTIESPAADQNIFNYTHKLQNLHRIGSHGRNLLESISSLAPNLTVSQDHTGDYSTLREALKNYSEINYTGHYVIYVKSGVYDEGPVNITKDMTNLVLLGDGCNRTIITGDASNSSGYTTHRSSSLGINGKGFIARGITFRNEAGPDGHQAVALRGNAPQLVFDNCCFEGYQGTLYTQSGEQYYKDCTIAGTVDFIFGRAIAVFQNCTLVARKPNQGQQNTYTAQGRQDQSSISGLFFQDCNLIDGEDLKSANYSVETYLGRPWKTYSTTLFMTSFIGGHVNSQGWLSWNTSNPFEDTCFYGEYANTGPGSNTSNRVNWSCVHSELSSVQAAKFSVSNVFANETSFIPSDVTVETNV